MPRKVYRKRKPTQSRKGLTALIKKVVHKDAETKSPITNNGVSGVLLFPDLVYAQNLNHFIAQGLTAETIIGEKIFIKNIRAKLLMFALNSVSAGQTDTTFRVAFIRTKQPLTSTNTNITTVDVFRNNPQAVASQGHLDLHKVDVLYDKTFHFGQPNQANVLQTKEVEVVLNINKTHYFDTDNGGYLKDKNYYMIYTAHKGDLTVATNCAALRAVWAINLKDS